MSEAHDPGQVAPRVGQNGGSLVGSVLGGSYRLTRLIGQGGMGTVYEGLQLRLQRRVAVKLMARELSANPEAIARFRREAEVTSRLGHPHIVQVFDFGAAPTGEPYLVMEYLEGEDLEKRLQRVGRLPAAAAAGILKQVASALSATHAQGIVHRDLKPANVFLLSVEGETDFVKVVDFGISKVRAATTKLTAALAVMGTPNYMAPEQAAGRVNDIDASTDQWALACIGYELLAGRPPFVGEHVASLLYQVIHEAPPPLADFSADLPRGVESVLRRGLAKAQSERFGTLTDFARAFEAAALATASPDQRRAAIGAAAPADAAMARSATLPSRPGGSPATTFSGAAGEVGAGPTAAVRRGRGQLLAGVGAGVVLAVSGFALLSRRSAGPTPAASSLPAQPPEVSAASVPARSVPAAPPARLASPDGGSAIEAAGPTSTAVAKRTHRVHRPVAKVENTATATQETVIAPEATVTPREMALPPSSPPSPPTDSPAPAPAPAWPPPPSSTPAPAWPPAEGVTPTPPKKRPSLFRRMLK